MYRLRELERKDINIINRWRRDSELIKLLGAPYRFINQEVDQKWFDDYMSRRNTSVRCAIVEENNDEILGLVSLVSIDYMNQLAELHIMIGDNANQGKGIGSFAVTSILKHAFYDLNLHRIELSVLTSNQRAINLYEKVGFVREGVKRKVKYKNGEFIDMYIYALLKEDFCLKG